MLLIGLSVMLMVVEITTLSDDVRWYSEYANLAITWLFVVELSIRYWVARNKARFFKTYWLDILAVLPIVRPLRVFRVFRVFRIFRLLRAGRLFNRQLAQQGAFSGPANEVSTLVAISATIVFAAAMMLYDPVNEPAFQSFPDALWFAVFSLVGGEPIGANPQTWWAKWVTLMLMIGGLTVFAMFVATVSATMVNQIDGGMHEMGIDELREHIVICGWNGSGPTVVRELFGPANPEDQAVVVVTEGEQPPGDLPSEGVRLQHLYTMQGDYTRIDVLEKAGIHHCAAAILLADQTIPRSDQDRDARTVLAALTVERLVPGIFTVAELTNRDNESLLRLAGVEEIVVGDWYAGVVLGNASRNRGLVQILDEVLTTERGNAFHTSLVPQSHGGKTVAQMHTLLLERFNAVLVSVEQGGTVNVNPSADILIEAGDAIVVLAQEPVIW